MTDKRKDKDKMITIGLETGLPTDEPTDYRDGNGRAVKWNWRSDKWKS